MKITTVAQTIITNLPDELHGTEFAERSDLADLDTSDLDLLGEMAGRSCYKSWTLPNPATAENEGYLGNILDHKHYSVLEHGSVTFYVEDVSRALLLELERHRHVSFSVESQRYVNTRKHHPHPVIPPAYQRIPELKAIGENLDKHYQVCLDHYDVAYNAGRDAGLSIKESREAARSFLLESTPVDLFVTGNLRAWRDVLGKRWSEQADAEIMEFAGEALRELKVVAPNSFQDISDEPYQ